MADFYEYNNRNSIARIAIDGFLNRAATRIENHPERLPFKPADGELVLGWLRALLDRKPSELES